MFRDLGTRLFDAAAAVVSEQAPDLAEALTSAARQAPKPQRALADLASIFLDLRRLGLEERDVATAQVLAFLRYATATKGAR
jgi:hypothetical protein